MVIFLTFTTLAFICATVALIIENTKQTQRIMALEYTLEEAENEIHHLEASWQ